MRPIPTILRSDELIDKSLKKASKIDEPYDKIFENKVRKENIKICKGIDFFLYNHTCRKCRIHT